MSARLAEDSGEPIGVKPLLKGNAFPCRILVEVPPASALPEPCPPAWCPSPARLPVRIPPWPTEEGASIFAPPHFPPVQYRRFGLPTRLPLCAAQDIPRTHPCLVETLRKRIPFAPEISNGGMTCVVFTPGGGPPRDGRGGRGWCVVMPPGLCPARKLLGWGGDCRVVVTGVGTEFRG